MQNRKNFLKTAAIGVAGAIGLTLIPSKALAENIPRRKLKAVYLERLNYFLPIGTMIDIKGLMKFHNIDPHKEMNIIVRDSIDRELGNRKGIINPVPFWHPDLGYGYVFEFDERPSDTTITIITARTNKTMQHIIDGTPDPFMECPYVD
jgi:hypothetical protein